MPYLPELLGLRFRIDHDYCLFMRRGDARGGLHGGSHAPQLRPLVPLPGP